MTNFPLCLVVVILIKLLQTMVSLNLIYIIIIMILILYSYWDIHIGKISSSLLLLLLLLLLFYRDMSKYVNDIKLKEEIVNQRLITFYYYSY